MPAGQCKADAARGLFHAERLNPCKSSPLKEMWESARAVAPSRRSAQMWQRLDR
jgi:hypothetical protein